MYLYNFDFYAIPQKSKHFFIFDQKPRDLEERHKREEESKSDSVTSITILSQTYLKVESILRHPGEDGEFE